MHHCRPKVLPPIVHPTKYCDVHDHEKYIVPHVHPTHTTYHHHKLYEHVHTCPHTESNVTDVAQQHVDCCPGEMGPMPGPGGPGLMPGAGAPGPIPGPGGPVPGPMPGPMGPWR